ncbi:MAG: hypothetical protein Q4D62_10210 [Planctomycetia bacterium]|nr:hypothetical protein [Planctomycetia bacterium]
MEANLFHPASHWTSRKIATIPPADLPWGYSLTGMLVGVLCGISLWLYRKSWFVQTAGGWFLLAVFLLGALGFGARYNEMTLYVTYFSWAILPLAVLPLYWLFRRKPAVASVVVLGLAVFAFSQNVYFSWEILNLAKDVYTIP